jgi:hypothetical protein
MSNQLNVPAVSGGMDLSVLDTSEMSNKGIEVRIFNPKTQKETDIVITVLGQDSDAYKDVQRKQQARSLNAALKTGPRREEGMVNAAEDNVPEMLAATTVGWTGMLKDGADYPFSKANARWLYENIPLIRDQVLEQQRDRANFLAG